MSRSEVLAQRSNAVAALSDVDIAHDVGSWRRREVFDEL